MGYIIIAIPNNVDKSLLFLAVEVTIGIQKYYLNIIIFNQRELNLIFLEGHALRIFC